MLSRCLKTLIQQQEKLYLEKSEINMTNRGTDKLHNQYKNSRSNGYYVYVSAKNMLSGKFSSTRYYLH
jgi:hypothetical protein